MAHITANDLKTRGIAAIESSLSSGRSEAIVSVRGADRYVVMELAHYQHLRECELEAALAETRTEMAAGRFIIESPVQHVARLQAIIADEGSTDVQPAQAPAVAASRDVPARVKRKPTKRVVR